MKAKVAWLRASRVAGFGLTALVITTAAHADVVRPYGLTPSTAFAVTNVGEWSGNGVSPFATSNATLFGPLLIRSGSNPQSASDEIFLSPHNSATAAAHAAFGILRLEGHFLDGDPDPAKHAGAIADAGWIDTLTFVNPLLNGQDGQVTFGLHMEGNLFGDPPKGGARIHFGIDWGAQSSPALNILHRGQGSQSGPYSEHVNRDEAVTVGFTWGEDTALLVRAVLRTLSASQPTPGVGGGAGSVDFAHSLYWTGIQRVMTNGVEITDYDLITGSGVDFRNSFAPSNNVPEPATTLLVVIGLALAITARVRAS